MMDTNGSGTSDGTERGCARGERRAVSGRLRRAPDGRARRAPTVCGRCSPWRLQKAPPAGEPEAAYGLERGTRGQDFGPPGKNITRACPLAKVGLPRVV